MNELLGMFGYKEEITREAVEELQIKLLPEEDEDHMQPGGDDADKLIESDGPSEKAVDIKEKTPAVVVEVEGKYGSHLRFCVQGGIVLQCS